MKTANSSIKPRGIKVTQMLSINPVVGYIDKFCSEAETKLLIEAAKNKDLKYTKVLREDGSDRLDMAIRSAKGGVFAPGEFPLLDDVRKRVTGIFNYSSDCSEAPQILLYKVGGEYKSHFDSIPDTITNFSLNDARYFTAILYLNDGFKGGMTRFQRLDITVNPQVGRLLFWSNTRPGENKNHPLSLHAGMPVVSGEKWLISFWIHRPQ